VLIHRTNFRDGTPRVIECRGTVLVDEHGAPTGTTGVAFDVTERERHDAALVDALARERELAASLQLALLPKGLPAVAGVRVAARYVAAEGDADVGGDWYAVLPLAGDAVGLAVGDVAGHGLDAVADMASVRFSLRALGLTEPAPERVLEALSQVVRVFSGNSIVTALYGILDPSRLTWTYATAGHCWPVLRRADGGATLLEAAADPPLGVATTFRRHVVQVEAGSTLVLYTDGLVERRNELITTGFERLRLACEEGPADPEALCDHLVRRMRHDATDDDIAILAVTIT
jgi:serine phosphatase RsbU (regulator of sigma subunit)